MSPIDDWRRLAQTQAAALAAQAALIVQPQEPPTESDWTLPGVAPFSPMGWLILKAVSREGWTSRDRITEEIADEPDVRKDDIPALLRDLKERGAIESLQSKGYRRLIDLPGEEPIKPAPPKDPGNKT